MKKQSIILSILLIWNWPMAYASTKSLSQKASPQKNSLNSPQKSSRMFKNLVSKFTYSYIDFDFNSTQGNNYNRFQGHSDLYSAGADSIMIGQNLYAGLYLFKINTHVKSQVQLTPGGPFTGSQTMKNNTIFAHVLKAMNTHVLIDIAGAYGQNTSVSAIQFNPTIIGLANSTNHNWFVGINGIYKTTWKKFLLKGNIGALHSQIESPGADIEFLTPDIPTKTVAPLTNKTVLTAEGAEIGYKLKPNFTPFINGTLVQVIAFSNSRSVIPNHIIGIIPQLEMNQDAYKLGGGIAMRYKHFNLRLEQKYYNAGGTFISNLTTIGIAYHFS